MTTIVMNTLNTAVTEYDWAFQAISPNYAADAAGLFALGGADDAGTPIVGEIRTGKFGGDLKQGLGPVYVGVQGSGAGTLIVEGESLEWEYPVSVRPSGLSRAEPGLGIDENYLAVGYRNVSGADFRIDSIAPTIYESKKRRIG